MLKLILAAALSLGTAFAQAQSVSSRSLTAPSTRDIGFISQNHRLDGTTTTEFSVAPLTVSNQGFGTRKLSVRLPPPPSIGLLLPVYVSNPVVQATVLTEANRWVAREYEPMRGRIAAWLRSRGVSQAYFSFSQEVMVSTPQGPRKKSISFLASVDASGRSLHGAPKLTDPDPTIVEAVYTPLTAAEGLPADWKFPNAGTLRWRLLNARYVELTGWQTIDVGGAYDNTDEGDPLARVPCLVDQANQGCGATTPSVRTLMDQQGSSFGLLSYVRRIEPYYAPGAATDQQAPNTVISVDQRIWNCSILQHKGSFGMEVLLQSDQFAVQGAEPAYTFQKVSEQGGRGTSPTTTYEVSAGRSTFPGLGPEQVMLAPLPGAGQVADNWWRTSDAELMRQVVYMAPIEIQSGSFSGFVASADVSVVTTVNAGAVKEYLIGTVSDNYWGSGVHDRNVYFNIDDVESTQEAAITEVGFDDWQLIVVNGTAVYVGPYGGNTLEFSGGTRHDVCSAIGPVGPSRWTCYTRVWVDTWWDSGEWRIVFAGNYANCTADVDGWGRDRNVVGYDCGKSTCPVGSVQYVAGATNYSNGCGNPELRTQWRIPTYIDLRPYLRAGQNHIFSRTVVAGRGEMWYRLRVRGCE